MNYDDELDAQLKDPKRIAASKAIEEEIARRTERIMALARRLTQPKQEDEQPSEPPVTPRKPPTLRLVK